MTDKAKPLLTQVINHIRDNVDPITEEFYRLGEDRADRWSYAPGQLELLDSAKQKRAKVDCGTFSCPTPKQAKGCRTLTTLISKRLMVLKAARAMDVLGNKEARIWVSMIKAMVPEKVCQIIDQSMQVHGATGISQWNPFQLCIHYTSQRTSRYADGPDEVHHHAVARAGVRAFEQSNSRPDA